MIGCGLACSFEQLLLARWLTGIGSALQNTGAQLFLADISTPSNRAQSLGINQVRPPPDAAFAQSLFRRLTGESYLMTIFIYSNYLLLSFGYLFFFESMSCTHCLHELQALIDP